LNRQETIQAYEDAGMHVPFYLSDKKYWKNNLITKCTKCKDTSFELLEKGKPTDKCCRCGEQY